MSSYDLQIIAIDDGNLSSSANLTINIGDENDNYPEFLETEPYKSESRGNKDVFKGKQGRRQPDLSHFDSNVYYSDQFERVTIRIPESLPIGSRVTEVVAKDKDINKYADITYHIVLERSFALPTNETSVPNLEETESFSIEPKNGVIIVANKLKPNTFYLLNISATDGGGLASYTTISIAVYDINDHVPRFQKPVYNFEVLEGEYLVGEVGDVIAIDGDSGVNADITYQIIFYKNFTNDQLFPFYLVENTGAILVKGTVDREEREVYEFSVVATDLGDPQLSSSVLVHIDIVDINDHRPQFYDFDDYFKIDGSEELTMPVYRATVPEDVSPGTLIATVHARDIDSPRTGNGVITYSLPNNEKNFFIDANNGTIYTMGSLDYETASFLNVTVIAQDQGSPPISSTALLQVIVENVKEELTTRVFDQEQYKVCLVC